MKILNNPAATAILILVVAAGAIAAGADDITVMVDGVPHIRNGDAPRDGQRTLELEEQWRVGATDDDIFFGLVTKIEFDAAGYTYVLDSQLLTVYVFDTDGNFVRTLFQEGEGPGEIGSARDMIVLGDGRVGAVQEFPGKIVLVDAMGNPAGNIKVGSTTAEEGGSWALTAGFSGGDMVLMSGVLSSPGEPGTQNRRCFLSSFNEDGSEAVCFAEAPSVFDFRDFVFSEGEHIPGFWWNSAVGIDGKVYTADALEEYRINVFDPDGTLVRVIERDYERWQRTQRELELFEAMIDNAMSGNGIPYRVEVLAQEPDLVYSLRGLRARADGTLWALSSRGTREQSDGVLCTFDVYDADGVFAEQVSLHCPGVGFLDSAFFAPDGRVVVVHGYADAFAAQWGRGSRISGEDDEEAAPMEIVCYRIVE